MHTARRPGDKIVDADEAMNCPEFSSLLSRAKLPSQTVRAVLRISLIAAVLIGAASAVRHVLERQQVPAPVALLRVSASAPASSFKEDGFPVRLLVSNQADHEALNVRAIISGSGFRALTCQSITPAEAFLEETPTSVSAQMGNLGPGEIRTVEFRFIASRSGEIALTALVVADNLSGPARVDIKGVILAW